MNPPPSSPDTLGLVKHRVFDLLEYTPLGPDLDNVYVWGVDDIAIPDKREHIFRNTGYKTITFKDLTHHLVPVYLHTNNSKVVPTTPINRTLYVIGTENDKWEPGKEIMFVSGLELELPYLILRFNEAVDDLHLTPDVFSRYYL